MGTFRNLLTGVLVTGASISQASQPSPSGVDLSRFTPVDEALLYPTEGCGGAMLMVPRPGTQFTDATEGMAPDSQSFFARAAAMGAKWATELECTPTGHSHALQNAGRQPACNSSYVTLNWAGYQMTQPAKYVYASWHVPTVVNPPVGQRYSTTGYYSSTWTGIGGGECNPGTLIQAGSAQQLSSTNAPSYYIWYEIVGGSGDTGGELHWSTPTVSANTPVHSTVYYDGSNAVFAVCNETTGVCAALKTLASSAPSATAEWITEAPADAFGNVLPLADFSDVNFKFICWKNTYPTGTCSGLASPVSLSLERYVFNTWQILASPVGLMSMQFSDHYEPPTNGNN
jgi:hypothetical protein